MWYVIIDDDAAGFEFNTRSIEGENQRTGPQSITHC
jgi:hypothetical protein